MKVFSYLGERSLTWNEFLYSLHFHDKFGNKKIQNRVIIVIKNWNYNKKILK